MVQQLSHLRESSSQTAGPYVHIGCTPNVAGIKQMYGGRDLGADMAGERTKGRRISVVGRVLDGIGAPVRDALVEIWQADHAGLFNSPFETRGDADPEFPGWGRQAADWETGGFEFKTIRPGRVPYLDGRLQAPHLQIWVAARGINLGLHTRMYFSDEADANSEDPVLNMIAHKSRIPTLMGTVEGDACSFDIRLQGDRETVFFDV